VTAQPVVLVDGASRGLGYALARAQAARGAHVVALARTSGGLEELDDAIQADARASGGAGAATLTPLDVTDDDGLARLGAAIHERWGRLDGWMHAAAHAAPCSPAAHADAKDLDRAWAVNARATQRLIRVLDPLLRQAPRAQAVWFDDPRDGAPFFTVHAMTKAAARAAWAAWARESDRAGLRVLRALPPPMPTAHRARFYPGEDRDRLTRCAVVADRLLDALDAGPQNGATLDLSTEPAAA
jgi:NAD(P)-dependent dehydrogenase (short-subunit alcohol dehydrogenase family)